MEPELLLEAGLTVMMDWGAELGLQIGMLGCREAQIA